MNTFENGPQLKYADEALILPIRPLKPHARYTVAVSAKTKSGKDISRRWHVTTGGGAASDLNERYTENTLEVSCAAELAAGEDYSAVARVINLDRSKRRRFLVKSRNTQGKLLASARLRVGPGTQG